MCDYSLMKIRNRLAVEGDDLTAHRFDSGSTGLVSSCDYQQWRAARPEGFWNRIRSCFAARNEPAPVVCIPPGARLCLTDLAEPLRRQFRFSSCEEVTFTQISANAGGYRDALVFANGNTLLLQLLPEGQTLTVLSLSTPAGVDPVSELERRLAGVV
jgi:hypothetical protein